MDSQSGHRDTWLLRAYLWAAEQLYGSLAWAYDAIAWLVSFGYWSRWRLDALAYLHPGSVLEVGFGTGAVLISLAERSRNVTGLDPSAQMQKVTARKLAKQALQVKRVRGLAERMPFAMGTYDNVLSTFPSKYILNPETLSEIWRVLSRSGRCVIVGLGVQFNGGIKRWLTDLWLGRTRDGLLEQFSEMVKKAGFSVNIVKHQTETYTLPVWILEKNDAA
jgi:ubiquinone/menaquinone biosynthesis C-methylase UbiE